MQNLKSIIGKNIKFYRLQNKLTQEKLAIMLKITTPSLSKIENGNSFPSYENLINLIKILNLRPYQLFITDNSELTIDDKELQVFLQEKFKNLDYENRAIIYTIIDALSKKEN